MRPDEELVPLRSASLELVLFNKLDARLAQQLQLLLAGHQGLLLLQELVTQLDFLLEQRQLKLSSLSYSILDFCFLQENLRCCLGVGVHLAVIHDGDGQVHQLHYAWGVKIGWENAGEWSIVFFLIC